MIYLGLADVCRCASHRQRQHEQHAGDNASQGWVSHTSPYYNQMGNTSLPEPAGEAGVTTLRFGGGGYADVHHWSVIGALPGGSGITGGGLSPWWGEAGNFGYVGPAPTSAVSSTRLDQFDGWRPGRGDGQLRLGAEDGRRDNQCRCPTSAASRRKPPRGSPTPMPTPSIYGTANDIVLGVDQQGNDWKTAGYWAKLRASTPAEYQTWATADGVYNPRNAFLAIDRDTPVGIKYWEIGNETFGTGYYGGGNGYSVDYDVPYDGTNGTTTPIFLPPSTAGSGRSTRN